MPLMTFSYTNSCNVSSKQLTDCIEQMHPEIIRIQQAQQHCYKTDYASLNLLHDAELIDNINNAVKEQKSFNPTLLIVIGIGGSNLGTVALMQALYGNFYNENADTQIYFVDTVDTDYVSSILHKAERTLCSGNNIVLNVISKSGTTTESIANFELFLDLLKKHRPYSYHQFTVISTDKNSLLWQFGQSERMTLLEIPEKVGGRYSVFSAVGLFPLALCGVDIQQLHQGARNALKICTTTDANNPAAVSAAILYSLYPKGYVIHDTFLFSIECENLGKWYRQLMAESIGKSHNRSGELVHNGITPTVSIGSTDLHSVAQLYLSGPYNIFTTFVSIKKNKTDLPLNNNSLLQQIISHDIQSESLSDIMNAILQGTMIAYKNDNRPYSHIAIPEKNEYSLGQFMQMKMLEIIYLGFLMNINPFDQPNVELYKKETRKILSQKN